MTEIVSSSSSSCKRKVAETEAQVKVPGSDNDETTCVEARSVESGGVTVDRERARRAEKRAKKDESKRAKKEAKRAKKEAKKEAKKAERRVDKPDAAATTAADRESEDHAVEDEPNERDTGDTEEDRDQEGDLERDERDGENASEKDESENEEQEEQPPATAESLQELDEEELYIEMMRSNTGTDPCLCRAR